MFPKSMYFNSFLITLVILFAIVACENPERQSKQKTPNNNKQACRYNKGPWSECANGEKSRTDTLKTPNAPGCEPLCCAPTRVATKKCKPACRYSKGDWTPCENGEKKRTLTRLEGDGPECEPTKTITKQCANQPGSKKSKQPRNKNRKSNSSTVTQSQTF